jgi:hypothetical protein
MRKTLGTGAVLLAVAVALSVFLHWNKTAPANAVPEGHFAVASQEGNLPRPPAASSAPSAPPAPRPAVNLSASAGILPDPTPQEPLPQETVLENVRRMVHEYGAMFGGNPVGTNPEITSQLSGENPKHIDFIAAHGGMQINGDGDLVDQWGSPYFFHQISGTEMEIHSAGPDKVMWTADDLVVK